MTDFQVPQGWEAVVGLEIHAQLATKSKLFCDSPAHFGAGPNEHVGPIDSGLPGVLPYLNTEAVNLAIRAGLALNCEIQKTSVWSRKHYFYPDLPKGYQMTQYDQPICLKGWVHLDGDRKIRIHRIHMEEDAGKNVHGDQHSFINLNRAGVPLVEIVSEPDIRLPHEAAAYMKRVRNTLRFVDVCDGNMEEGSLRCDVNVSIRKEGGEAFGTKVELKNLNSFRFVEKALEVEIGRQVDALENGETIVQETRLYDVNKNETFSMRAKEDAHDYRYMPEPDLPPLVLSDEWINREKQAMPELPEACRARLVKEYGIKEEDAGHLSDYKVLAAYFEKTCAKGLKNGQQVANWILSVLLKDIEGEVSREEDLPVKAEGLAALLALVEDSTISGKIAKTVYEEMLSSGKNANDIVEEKGLKQITDEKAILEKVEEVLDANAAQLQSLLEGKDKLMGFFVGQIMKATQGKANPQLVQKLLKTCIEKRKAK